MPSLPSISSILFEFEFEFNFRKSSMARKCVLISIFLLIQLQGLNDCHGFVFWESNLKNIYRINTITAITETNIANRANINNAKLSKSEIQLWSTLSNNNDDDNNNDAMLQTQTLNDVTLVVMHVGLCLLTATILSFYEGFDCTYLKPQSATLRQFPISNSHYLNNDFLNILATGTRGMGRGTMDRADGWYQSTYFDSFDRNTNVNTMTNTNTNTNQGNGDDASDSSAAASATLMRLIPSYNEIMEQHRFHRVPTWKRYSTTSSSNLQSPLSSSYSSSSTITQSDVQTSTGNIYKALQAVFQLKQMAQDYDWDQMKVLLKDPVLTTTLEDDCTLLRSATQFLDADARTEIGFDWGSCAWRHCGAKADAQEALAEIYNSIGMFEPFECLFGLDIVERSLRDVLAVVPIRYHPHQYRDSLPTYQPYQSLNDHDNGDASGVGAGSSGLMPQLSASATMDNDFLNALNGLRNTYTADD